MSLANEVIVRPSFFKMLAMMTLGGLGMLLGLFLIFGISLIIIAGCFVVAGLVVLNLLIAVIRQRPQVVIGSQAFTVKTLFGQTTRDWSEVVGPFAVIKLGWTNVVGYKLRQGGKGAHLGYDAVVGGPLELPMDELARLLNDYHCRALPAENSNT